MESVVRCRPAGAAVDRATVTVVIPCYNYARYLPAAVDSALSQSGMDVNIIIVDDASRDDSLAIAQALASRDRRVTVISHDANMGPVTTFNDGLAQANGEFLVRLDADDLLTPGSLARAVALMRSFPSVGLVYGHPLHFSGEKLPAARSKPRLWTIWPGVTWLEDRCRTGCNVITSPEVLMRRSVVAQVGGQRPLAHTHDMEMWLRMSAFCDVAYIHGVDQAWHREHPASLSRKVDAMKDLLERRDAFTVLFEGPAGCIPSADRLRSLATTAIATDAIELASRQFDRRAPDWDLVARLRGIAASLVPDIRLLHGFAGLERRMAMGPPKAARHPPFFVERIVRGLAGIHRRRRWHRMGV